jgi:intein/homing endonuclease
MNEDVIPEEIRKYFKYNDINFVVSIFEQYLLNDLYQSDMDSLTKLNRNVTTDLINEIKQYISEKRNIRYNCLGETRSHTSHTLILMRDFSQKKINSIEVGDEVLSYNFDTQEIEAKKVKEVFLNGVKDTYEITIDGSRKITTSELHKFLSIKKVRNGGFNYIKKNGQKIGKKYSSPKFSLPIWKEVRDLKVGDYIAVPNGINVEKSCKIDLNELKLLGFWLADGYKHKDERICFDLSKQHKIDYLKKLESQSDKDYKFRTHDNGQDLIKHSNWAKGYKFHSTKKVPDNIGAHKDYISQLIIDLSLFDKKCDTKFIPNIIKMGTRKEVIALLSGLFSGDGHIDINKGLIFNTTSKQLHEDVKICLTKIGIIYSQSLKKVQKSHHRQSYEVLIGQKSELEKLVSEFDLDEGKYHKIIEVIKSRSDKSLKKNIVINGLLYKRVNKIEYRGKQKVYDIEVEKNHNYIGNLILTHNSGKSLSMLALVNFYCVQSGLLDFAKNIEYIVCGNQVEYRGKLKDAKFGDFFLIDENFFTRSGMGANIEALQLKDYNNTIAKKNIGNIFITPETFLSVGAVLGFATYGRDSKNWLSRLLVYKFKGSHPHLVGYIVLDVGRLFMEHGCFLYKTLGGCNNNKKVKYKNIPEDLAKYSFCIPKDYDTKLIIENEENCPFYNVCTHPLCRYEKKKDSWITKSMEGTLDERTFERYKLSLNLTFELLSSVDTERNIIKYNCRNAKDMKNIVRMRIKKYTNTKLGIAEFEEVLQIIISNSNIDFTIENLHTTNIKEVKEKYFTHSEFGDYFKEKYDEYVKSLPEEEKKANEDNSDNDSTQ